MPKSYETFDKPYRRGLVLGLSLAELFLILLFILLLVATAIVQEYETSRQNLQDELNAIKKIIVIDGEQITEEQFQDLIQAASNTDKLRKEVKRLQDELDKLRPITERMKPIDQALKEKEISEEDLKKVTKIIEDIIKKSRNADELEEKLALAEDHEPDNNTLAKLQSLANTMDKKNYSNKDIEKIIEKIEKEIENYDPDTVISALNKAFDEDNYQNPCWFVHQPQNIKKKKREVKIFKIRINDKSLDILPSPLKKYSNNPNLDLGDITAVPKNTNKKTNYSYSEFKKEFKVFYDIGEEKIIQKNFRCKFFVDLWDNTSTKNIYKNRLEIVEGYFFIFENKGAWKN